MKTAQKAASSVPSPTHVAPAAPTSAVIRRVVHFNPNHDFYTGLRLAPAESKLLITFGETEARGYTAYDPFVAVFKHHLGVKNFHPDTNAESGFTDKQYSGVSGLRQMFDLKVFLESAAPIEAKATLCELLADTGFASHFSDEVRRVAALHKNEVAPALRGNS